MDESLALSADFIATKDCHSNSVDTKKWLYSKHANLADKGEGVAFKL